MLTILNRLAWMVSFVFGFFVLFMLAMLFEFLDFDQDLFLIWLILSTLLALLFKKSFLSQKWITQMLASKKAVQESEEFSHEKKESEVILNIESEKADDKEKKPETEEIESIFDLIKSAKKDYKKEATSDERRDDVKAEKIVGEEAYITKPAEPNFLQKFFQENVLAKIGGILLFLAVLFLLQLVYTRIGPVGKLLIGFFIGFSVFIIGLYLDKKKYKKESRVMLGTAILINYLVILSGRYLIAGDLSADEYILGETVTFFFLVLNTIFAVSTALLFKSRTILFMAFVVAYLNPFLIGAKTQTEPYTLVFYGLIVSAGAIVLSIFYKKENSRLSENLLATALGGGNILILLSPFTTELHFVFKLAAMGFLSLTAILTVYKIGQKASVGKYFIALYAFFIALIFYGNAVLVSAFSGFFPAIACLIFLAFVLLSGVFAFTFASLSNWFLSIILFPLALIALLFGIGLFSLNGLSFIFLGALLIYTAVFVFISKSLSTISTYGFFAALGVFIFFGSGFLSNALHIFPNADTVIYNFQAYGIMVAGFIFLLFAYYFAGKKHLEYLYSMATIFGIIALLPVLARSGDLRTVSIVSIVLLFIANISLPFIHKNLLEGRIYNLVLGIVAGVLFVVGELFYFWYGDMNQSKITLGLSFAVLAIIYFFLSYVVSLKVSRIKKTESSPAVPAQIEEKEKPLNVVYAFLGISISVFSLAIAYIFSTRSEIVATVWIFEAVLMFFFYGRTRDLRIYIFGIILGFIGLIKYSGLIFSIKSGEYIFLLPFIIVLAGFATALKFLDFKAGNLRWVHDVFHVLGLFLSYLILLKIIPNHQYGWAILGTSVLVFFLSFLYGRFYSGKIKYVFTLALFLFFYQHISELRSIFYRLDRENLEIFKLFQVFATIIFAGSVFYLNKLIKIYNKWEKENFLKLAVSGLLALYLFVISSLYVFYFFAENSFIVTIYWGLLSLFFLAYGIEKDYIKFRTVGLYILSLTTLKILIYDIWSGLDNAIMRVVALMVVGGIMIGVSIFYSKKYGSNLKGEFEFKNLK